MYHVGRVNKLQTPENLIEKVAGVFVCQWLVSVNDLMQVTLHKVQHNIHILKVLHTGCHNLPYGNDIIMFEVEQNLDLSIGPGGQR